MTVAQPAEEHAPHDQAGVVLPFIPSAKGVFNYATADLAIELVDKMEVLDRIAEWKAEAAKGPGGRPATFSYRALLVALLACALDNQPLLLTQVCDMMFHQLSSKHRAILEIPDPPAKYDTPGWEAKYRNVRSRFADLIDLMDPTDTPKNRRLDPEAFLALVEQHRNKRSDEDRALRYGRLEWFINRLLEASLALLPKEVLQHWVVVLGVDGTFIPSHSRPPRQKKKAKSNGPSVITRYSADPQLCVVRARRRSSRQRWQRIRRPQEGQIRVGPRSHFGYLGPREPGEEAQFPNLVVAMSVLDKPGHRVAQNAIRALSQLHERGYSPGLVVGDRAYSNSKAELFQLPARALGHGLVLDYKSDQLGVMAQSEGFLQIEGAWYCPSIPQILIDATIDFRAHRIDETTYVARLEERWKYLARPKAKPDSEGHVRLACPASGPSPQARCDLKAGSIRPETQGRIRIALKSDVQAAPPPSCSQQSVTIPPEAGAKFDQALLYGSPEWQSTYATMRNTNEGFHGYVKDEAQESLAKPQRRRLHGVAPQAS